MATIINERSTGSEYSHQTIDESEDGHVHVCLRDVFSSISFVRKPSEFPVGQQSNNIFTSDQLDCLRQLPVIDWTGHSPLDNVVSDEFIIGNGIFFIAKSYNEYFLVNCEGYNCAWYAARIHPDWYEVIGWVESV